MQDSVLAYINDPGAVDDISPKRSSSREIEHFRVLSGLPVIQAEPGV